MTPPSRCLTWAADGRLVGVEDYGRGPLLNVPEQERLVGEFLGEWGARRQNSFKEQRRNSLTG